MQYKNIVAWGIIASLSISILAALEVFGEETYSLAGFGFFIFGIWAAVILLNYKNEQ